MSAERAVEVLRPFTDIAAALEQGAPDSPLARDVAADLRAGVERAAGLLAEPTDQDQRETCTEWGVRFWPGDRPLALVDEAAARKVAADHERAQRRCDVEVVRREVGPWVEVPSP